MAVTALVFGWELESRGRELFQEEEGFPLFPGNCVPAEHLSQVFRTISTSDFSPPFFA